MNDFPQLISSFTNRVEAIEFSFGIILDIIELNKDKNTEEFNDFVRPLLKYERIEPLLKVSMEIPFDKLSYFSEKTKQRLYYDLSLPIVKRNFIIALVSEFDIFLSQLIRIIFYNKPEILSSLDKQISFKQLLDFEDIDNAKEYIIEKEIESILRDSHTEHFKWLETRLGFQTLRKFDTKVWQNFIELTERRNLFVHCDGIVSSQYIKVCRDNEISIDYNEVGKKLGVDKEYFKKAYDCIYELSIKLAHTIWRKLQPERREEASNNLNGLCLALISIEKYELAIVLLDFALSEPIIKKASLATKFLFILNKAQALKWSGKSREAQSLIAREDWSACCDEFNLAKAVLLDEFGRAAQIMKAIGNNPEKISIIQYRSWPIFKKFRETKEFIETYEEIFQEPFDVVTETSNPLIETEEKEG